MRSAAPLFCLALAAVAIFGVESACVVTGKVCTTEETKKCDDDLSVCIAKPPCDNPASAGYQACVDACKQAQCDCLTKCGNTCTK